MKQSRGCELIRRKNEMATPFYRGKVLDAGYRRPHSRGMNISLLFWILMLVVLIFGLWVGWAGGYRVFGPWVLYWVLLALLGWKVFGPAIHS